MYVCITESLCCTSETNPTLFFFFFSLPFGPLLIFKICLPIHTGCVADFKFFFEFKFIYFFIQQVFISHPFYTHQCIHVNCNLAIHHTPPTPPPLSPIGVHTFVLYICVSVSVLQTSSYVPFFYVTHICVDIQYLFFSF